MKKNKVFRSILNFIGFLSLVIILAQCANPVSPTGGPKDETPPIVISSEPENYSPNFSDREMSVEFNEFLQLKDLYNQMLISPPMENDPEIKIKKRSVVIKLNKEEKLKENTTYTIFLGNAVVDLTEANPHSNFEYVFSTGDYVDSLSILGSVKNSYTGLPAENVAVMLYTNENDTLPIDSLPYKVLPNYVAKTDEEGNFGLYNLRNVPYKIFALNDQNSNYLFDLPYEEVAFIDSMITPYFSGKRFFAADSTAKDSIKKVREKLNITLTELSMFGAIDSTQYISEKTLLDNYKYQIILDFPSKEFAMNPLNFSPEGKWKIDEPNKQQDSLLFWFLPQQVQDSLEFEFIVDGVILDTLSIVTNKKAKKAAGKKEQGSALGGLFKKKEVEEDTTKRVSLKLETSIAGGYLDLKQKIFVEFDYPLTDYDFSKLVWIEDSIATTPTAYFVDSVKRKFIIDQPIKEKTNYQLIIPDSVFHNLLNYSHDSLIYTFQTRSIEDYGNLVFTVTPELNEAPWIIQLMNDKEVVLYETTIRDKQIIKYDLLSPGIYKMRAIYDTNENGYWDTGNYSYKRQAEKVVYLESEIEVRANWDYEENWNLK